MKLIGTKLESMLEHSSVPVFWMIEPDRINIVRCCQSCSEEMQRLQVEIRCSGCGGSISEDESAFVMRGNQSTSSSSPTYVCYSCSLKSEEIFLFIRHREKPALK